MVNKTDAKSGLDELHDTWDGPGRVVDGEVVTVELVGAELRVPPERSRLDDDVGGAFTEVSD